MRSLQLGTPAPTPKPVPDHVHDLRLNVLSVEHLPIPDTPPSVGVFDVLSQRHTRRSFGPVSTKDLGAFLWYVAKQSPERAQGRGPHWTHRPTPSSGGLHVVEIISLQNGEKAPELKLYDPAAHQLRVVKPDDQQAVSALRLAANEVVVPDAGELLFLGANVEKMKAHYDNAESLIWRDAGVLIGVMSLVAEALALNFCPLGLTGEPHLSTALGTLGRFEGVGGAVIGSRAT